MTEGEQRKMDKPTVRDAEFYIEGADCIIRVDNTLFKVSDPAYSAACSVPPLRRSPAKIFGCL